MKSRRTLCAAVMISSIAAGAPAQTPTRARDLGVPFEGHPGPLNAITDVSGLEVGHTTILREEGPVRTGVTAVLPRGRMSQAGVFANWFALNGNGEMTGTTWVSDRGILKGPVLITNTYSVGAVHEAAIAWAEANLGFRAWTLPMVAETWDGFLNDITGFHVRREHVFAALDSARGGPVEEGSVGGGTGMRTFEFKSGIGTASRRVGTGGTDYTVGVLVQSNFGRRPQLRIAGVPVGREIPDLLPENPPPSESGPPVPRGGRDGSIIIVAATDAPLLPHQLKRVARRASLGLGRLGSISMNGSGDIFVAFSTANEEAVANESGEARLRMLANSDLNPLFEGVVQATEEAIVNSMVAARDMTGVNGRRIYAIPHERLREILRRHDRLAVAPD
ncbi:MAG: P1 family peptidase [Acidobacteriota bacterium]|nr:P1 family peptidase [Acidobacteriota bacterium]